MRVRRNTFTLRQFSQMFSAVGDLFHDSIVQENLLPVSNVEGKDQMQHDDSCYVFIGSRVV